MSKSFNQYTDSELLTLDNDTINDAIRIEAIGRGIQPPITLSEAIRKSEWRGYQKPAEAVEVFELVMNKDYGVHNTGVGFLSKARAEQCLEGALFIEEDRYSKNPGWKLFDKDISIMSRFVGVTKSQQAWAKLEEFTQDSKAFDEVMDECVARLSKVRQEDYNCRVNAEKKAEYLRLAGGDEAIAKGFWAKVEKTDWPQ